MTARLRQVLFAAFKGGGVAFIMTHNPLYHTILFFLAPFAILSGAFVGGMAARDQTKLGLIGTLFVGLVIGVVNWLPITLAVPLLYANWNLFPTPQEAAHVTNVVLWLWIWLSVYSGVTGIAGIWFRDWRLHKAARTALAAEPVAACEAAA